jgi:rubredoxin
MDRYICVNCGYVYDPETGDPASHIPPHTQFKDLPPDWVCPACYASQDKFDPLD